VSGGGGYKMFDIIQKRGVRIIRSGDKRYCGRERDRHTSRKGRHILVLD
jgi:hypothetical protein